MNLSPTDILGTSAIALLNFKQRLQEKSDSNRYDSIRRVNVSTKTSTKARSKREVTEERPALPPCYSPAPQRPHPSVRSNAKKEEAFKAKGKRLCLCLANKSAVEDSPKDEKEIQMMKALNEHKKLMKRIAQEKLQKRMNNSMISQYNQYDFVLVIF